MSDYDRFLKAARDHAAHIGRIAAQLLREKRIGQGTHDALTCAAGHLLRDAYMAGLAETGGVEDVDAELRRIAHA